MDFTGYWDYKPTNAIHAGSPGVYASEKVLNSGTIHKIHLRYDAIDGSVVNGLRQPNFFTSVLDKPRGYKVFSETEKIHFKKNKQICSECD